MDVNAERVLILIFVFTSNAFGSCPRGWTLNKATQKCYKFGDDLLSWSKAERRCQSEGGHLVSITSKEENDWVANFACDNMGLYPWIGLYSPSSDCVFEWTDGSPLNYSNWYQGSNEPEPCKTHEEQDYYCVAVTSDDIDPDQEDQFSTWRTWSCESQRNFICDTPRKTRGPLSVVLCEDEFRGRS